MNEPKKSRKPSIIPCGVALIRRGREFLISQRKKEDTFGSLWEFPGGKKDHDETFEDCVKREVREELGIDVRVERPFMEIRRRYPDRVVWLRFFLCTHLSGDPEPIESDAVQWADVADLKRFAFPPANDKVIRRLLDLCSKGDPRLPGGQ